MSRFLFFFRGFLAFAPHRLTPVVLFSTTYPLNIFTILHHLLQSHIITQRITKKSFTKLMKSVSPKTFRN